MSRLVRLVIVTALAVAAPLAVTASATGTSLALPRVLTCSRKTVVKPASYVLACADGYTYFAKIHWTSWGRTSAKASATYVQNTCTPTCVSGHFAKYPARLTLSKPVTTKYGLLFSVIRYSYTVSASSTLPLQPLSAVSVPSNSG